MHLIHHHKSAHGPTNSKTCMGETESCAGADEEENSMLDALSEQPSNSNIPSLQSPKRHRRRIETFLSRHHLIMSPQPRKERLYHRRRANSWHGGSKLMHLFHHERKPSVSLHDIPKLHEEIPPESNSNTGGEIIAQDHKNMETVDEEPSQLSVEQVLHDTNPQILVKPTKGNAFAHFLKAVEDFIFQRRPDHRANHHHEKKHAPLKKGVVLLHGCETVDEHYQKVKEQTERIRSLHGKEGLKAIDLEYRLVHCDAHQYCKDGGEESGADPAGSEARDSALTSVGDEVSTLCCTSESMVAGLLDSNGLDLSSDVSAKVPMERSTTCTNDNDDTLLIRPEKLPCHWCMQRLFHIPSGTVVDEENRKRFCADGDMYEEVARLCQEYAQDLMCQEGNLEWHVVEEMSACGHNEAIQMMVSKGHKVVQEVTNADTENTCRPTLLVATGRGKVRAGIFSRMHMMCSGLESATAIPLVREAAARGINVIVLDPNVHGDKNGFVTFTKCMDHYYEKMQDSLGDTGLYVLSHSASGGHIARYLLDKSNEVLAHFHAVAFTDSIHNIQWTKQKPAATHRAHTSRSLYTVAKSITDEQEEGSSSSLQDFLESDRCVYFRCANVRRDGLELSVHPAGEPVQTDAFWTHRFGKIRTLWAGTDEHSLTNWYSHAKIWEHFDAFLLMERKLAKKVET